MKIPVSFFAGCVLFSGAQIASAQTNPSPPVTEDWDYFMLTSQLTTTLDDYNAQVPFGTNSNNVVNGEYIWGPSLPTHIRGTLENYFQTWGSSAPAPWSTYFLDANNSWFSGYSFSLDGLPEGYHELVQGYHQKQEGIEVFRRMSDNQDFSRELASEIWSDFYLIWVP